MRPTDARSGPGTRISFNPPPTACLTSNRLQCHPIHPNVLTIRSWVTDGSTRHFPRIEAPRIARPANYGAAHDRLRFPPGERRRADHDLLSHGYVETPRGVVAENGAQAGPIRHLHEGAPSGRREQGGLGVALAPQASTHTRRQGDPTWWAPGAIAWWIGVLFAFGSACFALGALPAYADGVGTNADNLTYFIGSIFFTTAAFLQYFEAASTNPHPRPDPPSSVQAALRDAARADRLWWASARAIHRHALVQPHDSQRPGRRPRGPRRASSRLATGRLRVDLLPGLELARLGRGVSRSLRVASRRPLVVDHAPQPRRLDRVRRFRHCVLREAERTAGQPGVDQSRYVRRRALLPRWRDLAPSPGSGPGRRMRRRRSRPRQASSTS